MTNNINNNKQRAMTITMKTLTTTTNNEMTITMQTLTINNNKK